jgi:tRNA (guanine37-N1)-methyltransferase
LSGPIIISILTLYPEYFDAFLEKGVIGRAIQGERGREFQIEVIQIRDFALDKHSSVDNYPYGGGAGMVMRADVLQNALEKGVLKAHGKNRDEVHVIYPGPRGKTWQSEYCKEFANQHYSENRPTHLVFICGRFEGIDERFIQMSVDEQISLGDFILSGGELAVMTILDSSLRFVPGVLGNKSSAEHESFAHGKLEHGQYTKPREFMGMKVPEVLLSGHHANIENFFEEDSKQMTKKYRKDLIESKHV